MEYCRKLEFAEDPDYKYIIGLFENCLKKNNFDPKVVDYTWKQNRLTRDKEQLKKEVAALVVKKKKEDHKEEEGVTPTAGLVMGTVDAS